MPAPCSARELRPLTVIGARTQCSTCPLRRICLPREAEGDALRAFDSLLIGKRRVKRGQHVFFEGDPLKFLYAVRVGCFKTSISLTDGSEHVTGFAFAGELLGFDALATEVHAASAVALEDSEVCSIPYEALLALPGGGSADLRRRLNRMVGSEVLREYHLATLLATTSAEPRVAAFLLMVAQGQRRRGFSAAEFVMRMSRAEIGSYLGLTLETVSRAFSAFDQRGLLAVTKRRVRILDAGALAETCEAVLPGISRNFAQWDGELASAPAAPPQELRA
jgi:CRP/FNR family transcriptional regulator